MFEEAISELLLLTEPYKERSDLIQGPGGNTSVKTPDGKMLIKASGYLFSEMTNERGFSAVDAKRISNYFHEVQVNNKAETERESLKVISDSILKDKHGNLFPKPSMETGFHAVLDTYVVHTHSVWTNLVNCNQNRQLYLSKLEEKLPFDFVSIPYVSPGFGLSYLITKALKEHKGKPSVFFLENHGVIAHANELKKVHFLLEETDKAIAELFQIDRKSYPLTGLSEQVNGYVPQNDFCSSVLKKRKATRTMFDTVLFPDQTVFFKDNIGNLSEEKKITWDNDWQLIYRTDLREARSIHETMTSYLFLYDTILEKGDTLKMIEGSEVDYIQNMDMEKHRKALMNRKQQD